jgi:hypothetical protein
MSFLGKGSCKQDGHFDYDPVPYQYNGRSSRPTKFVQAAEIELLQPKTFDRAFVVVTEESHRLHFDALRREMAVSGLENVVPIQIEEGFSPECQWKWFQEIVQHIDEEDHLTVDLTHGYRAMSIVFSNAINFVQRVRRVTLEGVYYGAFESNRDNPPIVDMKDFFIIHEWAEGVSRLVEDADARKLAGLAETTPSFQFGTLADRELTAAVTSVSEKIRNVDVHRLRSAADSVIQEIQRVRETAGVIERALLEIIEQKFRALAAPMDPEERYDHGYFLGQLQIIKVLLDHQLYMQAFTAMREMIGSLGLIPVAKARIHSSQGRKQRQKAEVFLAMLQFPPERWNFSGDRVKVCEGLRPHYEKLMAIGVLQRIRGFLPVLLNCRNGFDHAWTSSKETPADLEANGERFLHELDAIVELLHRHGVFDHPAAMDAQPHL